MTEDDKGCVVISCITIITILLCGIGLTSGIGIIRSIGLGMIGAIIGSIIGLLITWNK